MYDNSSLKSDGFHIKLTDWRKHANLNKLTESSPFQDSMRSKRNPMTSKNSTSCVHFIKNKDYNFSAIGLMTTTYLVLLN